MSKRNIIFRENRGTGGGSGTTDEAKCINTNRYIDEDETFPKITRTETKGTRREKARRIELDVISSPFVNRPLLSVGDFILFTKGFGTTGGVTRDITAIVPRRC